MNTVTTLESILFVSGRPISEKKLAALLQLKVSEVHVALEELAAKYADSGIRLIQNEGMAQLVTSPENADVVRECVKEDTTGELSRPALETLSVIAYRGPVTKAEIEQVRGVNCAQSLRNLLIRGLIEDKDSKSESGARYHLSCDFLRYLGVASVAELPDYESLHSHERIQELSALDADTGDAQQPPHTSH